MKKEIYNFEIFAIGKASLIGDKQLLSINSNYIEGLKHLSAFSHAIVICVDSQGNSNILNTHLSQKVVQLLEVNEKSGLIQVSRLEAHNDSLVVYDIKPYFSNEDRVKECFMPDVIPRTKLKHPHVTENLTPLGTIQNKGGEFYLEIQNNASDSIRLLQGYSHIKIFWWFHKFDKNSYRRTLTCDPPYEKAPRTGVFASRSPVRPNPIALTTARILSLDEKEARIKVSKLDCFDQTPFIGFAPYNPTTDRVSVYHLPSWLQHWPEWLDDRIVETSDSPITIQQPVVESMQKFIGLDTQPEPPKDLFAEQEVAAEIKQDGIVIKGARQNNLKHIDVTIPYGKVTVITGVSGSGKSSLAFDTLFAESQQRFMESMSLAERSSFKQLQKPQFDQIIGLPPAIAISQRNVSRNPRSTVGTITDIYDFLRAAFANIGVRHCPECGTAITPLDAQEIVELLKKVVCKTPISICPYQNDTMVKTFTVPSIDDKDFKTYCTDLKIAVMWALNLGNGAINVHINNVAILMFQTTEMCYGCRHTFFELSPSAFSFNNPESMCPVCKGLGMVIEIDPAKIVSKANLSLLDGASAFWGNLRKFREAPNANWMKGEILALADHMGIDLEIPWESLPDDFKKYALYGTEAKEVTLHYKNKNGRSGEITRPVEGAYHLINRLLKSSTGETGAQIAETYMSSKTCACCNGERLSRESRMVTVAGTRFPEVVKMSLAELKRWLETLPGKLSKSDLDRVLPLLRELHKRLCHYMEAGLSYLTLDRSSPTLSGGELQRLRLVAQLSSGITNVLYILDEPSTGLHPKDHHRLLGIIKKLKTLGNTVVIVEHDTDTMLAADNIIDIGLGAGEQGGNLIAQGTPQEIMANDHSETGKYLSGKSKVGLTPVSKNYFSKPWISLTGVRGNNLKNINVSFPTCSLTCITGVSGSGKSSLIDNGIYPAVTTHLSGTQMPNQLYDAIAGAEQFEKIVRITQKPIGRTARSNPATYTGIMDEIRMLFAHTPEARKRGFKANRFSFNSKDGQCSVCHGEGQTALTLQFMADVWTECPVCKGKRYNPETLEIKYKEKSISDVLEMSIDTALNYFEDKTHEKLHAILKTLTDIGLGYLKLGQSSQTLSGGEAQRVKLAAELSLSDTDKTLYLLDEPTTGLHFKDIQNLLIMLRKITAHGNTVVLVEHNLDMIKNADWIIDLGLEGGVEGGYVVEQGTPLTISRCEKSYTGKMLKR